ncbi:clan AA aspartic protease (TIGR02281 family) [Sphingomonas vulcanisoli]|uniref:Clan AA aspartic protease (TIGR02281 family) n=1 Tax=Sphingomonas vulcanisoli TaxID=1658060 RepID=A0ABX0TVR3_9SPHN|nr:retropepsin-like aspartic protease [Sphingomonas vulcanisoli]NIJ07870.1 clan AA aspartic protease (TIGR02281 family) [Sphingomonas vulcanisoli]
MPSSVALTVFKFALVASILPIANEIRTVWSQPSQSAQSSSEQIERTDSPSIVDVEDKQRQIPVSADGLYHVDAKLNGRNVSLVVDSGANTTILTQADARRVGLKPKKMHFRRRIVTANGEASLATVAIPKMEVAGKNLKDVPVSVIGKEGGASLLGQDVIARLDGVSINDGVMTIAGGTGAGGTRAGGTGASGAGTSEKDTGEKGADGKSAGGEAAGEKGAEASEKIAIEIAPDSKGTDSKGPDGHGTDGKNAAEKGATSHPAASPPAPSLHR